MGPVVTLWKDIEERMSSNKKTQEKRRMKQTGNSENTTSLQGLADQIRGRAERTRRHNQEKFEILGEENIEEGNGQTEKEIIEIFEIMSNKGTLTINKNYCASGCSLIKLLFR